MALFPEKETIIDSVKEAPDITERIEKATGVTPVQTQLKPKQIIRDDTGQPLINTPQSQKVVIEIPTNAEVLTNYSKGSIENSRTWFGAYWLRIIKKALLSGWQIIIGKKEGINAN